ncbi:uncharacterized protein LOC101895784 [Musca domestica]|uniref:Uncharacterized protein LOC101895784 n=1 Tax=Musca domestica TaxID=7370 RepID=A0A9J7DGA9_MUSDO|nr:uncharacterized protein LOC101895784 [Musca domestica]
MNGFESIANNCEIQIYIYKLLTFKDQLRLARVSEGLRCVFERFIWPVKYEKLTVAEIFPNYVVTNETIANGLLMTADVFIEFLNFYSQQVHELTSYSHWDLKQFKNLTTLKCCVDLCWLELLQSVANNIPGLENIYLLSYNQDHKVYFTPYMVIHMFGAITDGFVSVEFVESLLRMKHLKRISLDYRCDFPIIRIGCDDFFRLIYQLPMEVLELSFVVEPENPADYIPQPPPTAIYPLQLKSLKITTTLDRNKWSKNYDKFMAIFQNLKSLNLRMIDGITEEILNTICQACPNLESLTIQRSTFFDISALRLPDHLEKLNIEFCYGLSYGNLKEILTCPHLREYISIGTTYKGDFENFTISGTIQKLALGGVPMQEFYLAYAHNENLQHLAWIPSNRDNSNLFHMARGVPPNLTTLQMKCCQVTMESLQQMTQLQSLDTWLVQPFQTSYILQLLRLPALQHLTLRIEDMQFNCPLPSAEEELLTNVIHLKLFYSKRFATDLDFWLDLFRHNTKMTMAISPYPDTEDSLRSLINHAKFPKSLKRLFLFGFTIKCDDLRRNFESTIKSIVYHRNVFDDPEDDRFFIVLRRG